MGHEAYAETRSGGEAAEMSYFKVQHIRFCKQCRELLPTKCAKCIVHPERKPRVVAIYDAPRILATGPCGCVKIICQFEKCARKRFMWRRLKADGSLAQHNHYCTPNCARDDIAAARTTRVTVTCAYAPCSKKFERKACEVKNMRCACCSPACGYLQRKVETAKKREAAKKDDGALLLQCAGKCRGEITDHLALSRSQAKCVPCGAPRGMAVKVPA